MSASSSRTPSHRPLRQLLASCLLLLLTLSLTACQSTTIKPEAENYRRLDQAYLNETLAENQFDPNFAAHLKGEFYPIPWVVSAERGATDFWLVYLSCYNQHGAKEASARLRQIINEHGLCMIMASTEAHYYFSDAERAQILLHSTSPPTKLLNTLYHTPGGDFALHNSSAFLERLPEEGASSNQ